MYPLLQGEIIITMFPPVQGERTMNPWHKNSSTIFAGGGQNLPQTLAQKTND